MKLYDSKGNEIIILERKDYVTYLGNINDNASKDYEIPPRGVFLLSVVSDYAAGGLFILESGVNTSSVKITPLRQSGDYLSVSSKNNRTITVNTGNATFALYLIKLFY